MKFVRYEDLQRYGISWSRVHLDRLQRAGQFPKKVRLGGNTVAYLESEITDWLAARVAERDSGGAA